MRYLLPCLFLLVACGSGVTGPNDVVDSDDGIAGAAPTPGNDNYELEGFTSTALAVLENDSDPDGDLDSTTVVIVTDPMHATVSVNPDGTVQYVHGGGVEPDQFAYTVSDMAGNTSEPAQVVLMFFPPNVPPVAVDDYTEVDQGRTVNIDIFANDNDSDGTILPETINIVTPPRNGNVNNPGDGTVNYRHGGVGFEADSFVYTVEDEDGGLSNEATVEITVFEVECAGWVNNGGCWYSGLEGDSCNQTCAGHCGFDQVNAVHNGNPVGMHFWPQKANGGDWVEIECSSTDNNTNWGANGANPDEFYTFGTCHLNCACLC